MRTRDNRFEIVEWLHMPTMQRCMIVLREITTGIEITLLFSDSGRLLFSDTIWVNEGCHV